MLIVCWKSQFSVPVAQLHPVVPDPLVVRRDQSYARQRVGDARQESGRGVDIVLVQRARTVQQFAARRVLVVGRHPLDVFFVDADQRRRMHGYADAQVFDGPDDGAELEVDARAVEVQRADIVHSVERKRVVVVCFRIVVVVAVENVLNADGESQIEDVLDVEASRYAVLGRCFPC